MSTIFLVRENSVLMKTLTLGVVVAALISGVMFWLNLSRLRAENLSLKQQVHALQTQAESLAGRLSERNFDRERQSPGSGLLRLRNEVSQLRRQLEDANAAVSTTVVAPSNRTRREEIAQETALQYETLKQTREQGLQQAHRALLQFAADDPAADLYTSEGKPNPELASRFPGVAWDDLQIMCHDAAGLRFLQSRHPEEPVASWTLPFLDPAGEPMQTWICANGGMVTGPEREFQHRASPLKSMDENSLMKEVRDFFQGH
jgi:hypothetical protein